jgi:DNA-binding FadR family transcriptional regulator
MPRDSSGHNLTQQLVHTLGADIIRGKYTPEQSLPSEAALCEQFDISRSAMREAVKMLASKGLLSSRPRQGIRIQPTDRWNLFDPDVLRWTLDGNPTLVTLKEFLQLRIAVEPEAAALAAENRDLARTEQLRQALARMKAAEEGLDDALEADIAFHVAIYLASGNPFYMQLRSFIDTALRVSIRYTNRIKGIHSASYEEHKRVYDAIARGNAGAARKASLEMQEEALRLITSELENLSAKSA